MSDTLTAERRAEIAARIAAATPGPWQLGRRAGTGMSDVTIESVRAKLKELHDAAEKRRKVSAVDPVADAIDFCVTEVGDTLDQVDEATTYLTPQQYARRHPARPNVQTVRRWIREGRLDAIARAHGYVIHRDAQVRPYRRAG